MFDSYRGKYGINPPHINHNGYICFSDRDEDIADYNNPIELIVFSIMNSMRVIYDGYYKLNTDEFIDEFYIHLSNLSNHERVYLLDNLDESSTFNVRQ